MKKIGLVALSFLIFLLSFSISFAQTASLSSNQEIDYQLPYPGLLPDSPLYIFRVARDKIVGFLISDSLKKSEFNLLQADKRLNAGIYLFNKGKIALAFSTVSKAENYFDEALGKMGEAKIQGRDISEMEGKLRKALEKHKQELKKFSEKTEQNFRVGFEKELKRLMVFEERLNQ